MRSLSSSYNHHIFTSQTYSILSRCRSSLRPLPERPSLSRSRAPTPSTTSRQRSKTRREFPQTSKDSSSPESNSRTAGLWRITTSRRSQLSISSSVFVEVCKFSSRP
ncbi:hypothetical protein L2E82_15211 [Cichorium intybus]|uniref:Uncharacterized protein n=1 Tax=Cichorium intybus TaxID=13427 RepID=A0ACB9F270_CICIN|nr:hypothetical protein L2E82_15211 [Cichorium intybus]